MVSRDLSRLRTSRAIMLCGKELAVSACVKTEIRLLCTYRIKASNYLIQCGNCDQKYFGETKRSTHVKKSTLTI